MKLLVFRPGARKGGQRLLAVLWSASGTPEHKT